MDVTQFLSKLRLELERIEQQIRDLMREKPADWTGASPRTNWIQSDQLNQLKLQ